MLLVSGAFRHGGKQISLELLLGASFSPIMLKEMFISFRTGRAEYICGLKWSLSR
jgi:hypothetical protein